MQHLDEGTIHAWLDGALAPNEASAAEAHVQACAQCAQVVAEARGLIAASSRILGALDDVPAVDETARPPLYLPAARRRGWWWRRTGVGYAAAATALLAVGTTIVLRSTSPDALMDRAAAPAVEESAQQAAQSESVAPVDKNPSATAAASPRVAPPSESAPKRRVAEADKKEAPLATDVIVPLPPGAMPRPAAQAPARPPAVRQREERMAAAADVASNVARSVEAKVQGRVIDASTGAPVPDATVSIDTTRVATRTDKEGKFQLQAVPLGQQTVSVRALGFEQAQYQVAIAPRDSVDLGFALQKSALQLEAVVTTGASRAAEGARGEARGAAGVVPGCYTLRPDPRKDRDVRVDPTTIAALPVRVQLDAPTQARANEAERRMRRRMLDGVQSASWRMVGDSLEVAWTDGARQHVVRFGRAGSHWTSEGGAVVLEPCGADPR